MPGHSRAPLRSPAALGAVLAAIGTLLSGCGLLGGLTTHRLVAPQVMTVTSPVFSADGPIPLQYTCHGGGLSPPLYWSGAPQSGAQRTKSFAILVDDAQAPITPYVYWLVFDISPATGAIPQNELPPGARQASNSRGQARYDPPCPSGSAHSYRFTVYALNVRLKLPAGIGLRAAWTAIAHHVIGIGRLTAYAEP
jgi:Raf kinase inhibitor-like YbhB/YbcL family protein